MNSSEIENEKPEECDACSFKTKDLKFYKHDPGYPENSGHWLCEVCRQTISGNANRSPSLYPDSTVLHMIAYCTNLIIREIRRIKP